jgi:hypothetical protein
VLIGDFNYVDDIQDKVKTQSFPASRSVVNYALNRTDTGLELVGIWKKLNNAKTDHNFHNPSGSSRFDRVYDGRYFAEMLLNIYLQSLSVSDHHLVQ